MGFYSEIKLDGDFNAYLDSEDENLGVLSGLSRINLFVGPNNSRKSRLLREILRINRPKYRMNNLDTANLSIRLAELVARLNDIPKTTNNVVGFSMKGYQKIDTSNIPIPRLSLFISHKEFEPDNQYQIALNVLEGLRTEPFTVLQYRFSNHPGAYKSNVVSIIDEFPDVLESLKEHSQIKYKNPKKFYIPTLRTLNYFGTEDNHRNVDFYKERIAKVYSLQESELNLKIFTGLSLYNKVRSMLLGDQEERDRISKYQTFLSTELFNGEDVVLIPKEKDDVLNIKIGNNEKPIYNLGDGIQSLILLTFPLFEEDSALFFIEEPETHLHPGLQRKLIEVLKKHINHQYFITSHSNHFLDLTLDYADTSIYTVRPTGEQKSKVELVSQDDENVLQLLGAKNTSVFLSNTTIWVEGVTDRLYIRKFLEIIQANKEEKNREDIDYSFVEYGGDNITHWSFLDDEEVTINIERLCGKSYLITDNDGDKKMERKERLREALGDRYKLLDCSEIENILSLSTLQRVLRIYEKNPNLILPKFLSDYPHKEAKLGAFIEKRIFKHTPFRRRGGYKGQSGTIKNKVDFCKKAIEGMSPEELSPLATELAESIYSFVLENKN